MESRACKEVKLDLLKSLTSDSQLRKIGTQDRSDRPWTTLVQALRQAIPHEEITEREVRRRVIEIYMQELACNSTSKIMEAKLEDNLSYFAIHGTIHGTSFPIYESADQVREHWPWYLCCLSYEEGDLMDRELLHYDSNNRIVGQTSQDLEITDSLGFSRAFRFTCRICSSDFASIAGKVILEATYQRQPVLQLVFGSGEYCGRLVLKIKSKSGYGRNNRKECVFVQKKGFITGGETIHKQTMTVEDAKKKALTLRNCRGFYFQGPDIGRPVEIFFRSSSEIGMLPKDPYGQRYNFPGAWISFKMEDCGLQDWLVSEPLEIGQWEQVCLEKRPRHFSLQVGGRHCDSARWDAAEDMDPYYSEVSTSDVVRYGGSGFWLADVVLKSGEIERLANVKEQDMFRMPLDKVDLQAVAVAFETEITVDHLDERTWIFSPHPTHRLRRCARLLRYVDLWAAVTTPRASEDEALPLTGAIVELDIQLAGHLRPVSRRSVAILGYDVDAEAYQACVDAFFFFVQRSQIARVIYQEESSGIPEFLCEDEGPELFRQMPPKSLVFYLLLEWVKKIASQRLQTCHLIAKGSLAADALLTGRTQAKSYQPSRPAIAASAANSHQPSRPGVFASASSDIQASASQQVVERTTGASWRSHHTGAQSSHEGSRARGIVGQSRPAIAPNGDYRSDVGAPNHERSGDMEQPRQAIAARSPNHVSSGGFGQCRPDIAALSPSHVSGGNVGQCRPAIAASGDVGQCSRPVIAAPSPNHASSSSSHAVAPRPMAPVDRTVPAHERISLQEVRDELSKNRSVVLSAVHNSIPENLAKTLGPKLMRIPMRDRVFIQRISGNFVECLHNGSTGWCPLTCLTIWKVRTAFKPDARWENFDSFLSLEVGQDVLVTEKYDGEWGGWGRGFVYNVHDPEGVACRERDFLLSTLVEVPDVLRICNTY